MSEAQMNVEAAERQLDRVHSQFSRIETKSSFLLATNVGLLALVFYNADYQDFTTWYVMLPFVAALVLVAFARLSDTAKNPQGKVIWEAKTFMFAGTKETVYGTSTVKTP